MLHNLVLVGPMGAGKSTLGRLLATRLNYQFLDTDNLIEERTGADIPWIFDVEGEEGFRERETAVLEECVGMRDSVVATGGGIVLRTGNRELLARADKVVYLQASIEHLVERTHKDKRRPLLQVEDPRAKIVELYHQRDPLYRSVADEVVVTDGQSLKTLVQNIVDLI